MTLKLINLKGFTYLYNSGLKGQTFNAINNAISIEMDPIDLIILLGTMQSFAAVFC